MISIKFEGLGLLQKQMWKVGGVGGEGGVMKTPIHINCN